MDYIRSEYHKLCNCIHEEEQFLKDKLLKSLVSHILDMLKDEKGRQECTEFLHELLNHKEIMDLIYDQILEKGQMYISET